MSFWCTVYYLRMKLTHISTLLIRSLTTHIKNAYRLYSVNANGSPAEYCMDIVKKNDYENFLSTLLLPSELRSSAFAIRAFNIEVARIQDNISDTRMGQMRLKFWEETVEKMYKDDVAEHPVVIQLHCAVKRHRLSKRYLKRLISIRENYLVTSGFPTMESMEAYAEHSVSSVYYLLLELAGVENVHADHAASHLGKAQGISNLIRSTIHNAEYKIITLPQDVLLENNISHESIFRGNYSHEMSNAVFSVANCAKQHLEKARSLSSSVPKAAFVLFLPAVCVDSYLERLRQTDFNIYDGPLQRRNVLLPIKLYWKKYKGQY